MRASRIAAGVLIIALFAVPAFTQSPYYLNLLIVAGIQCVLAVGLWMVLTAGNITVAQSAFMGIGAYVSALLTMHFGWSFWEAFPICGLVAGIFGLLLGFPTLRLRGVYFVMATIGFGMILTSVWDRFWWAFGQAQGVVGIPEIGSISLFGGVLSFGRQSINIYYLVLVFVLVSLLIMYRMTRSRIGLTFSAIRWASPLAASVGINLSSYRLVAFTVACFLAGVVGSLYAHYIGFISSQDFVFGNSMNVLMAAVIGGTGAFFGPIVGVGFITVLGQALASLQEYLPLVQGVVLILVMVFMPGGIWGAGQSAFDWLKQRLSAPPEEAVPEKRT